MATTLTSAALVPVTSVFSNTERLALAGFLAAYSGLTRQAYELDLRQYAAWSATSGARVLAVAAPERVICAGGDRLPFRALARERACPGPTGAGTGGLWLASFESGI